MEAFIVPTIQPQALESQQAQPTNKATNESSFGPTLSKAIEEQNTTESEDSENDFTSHQHLTEKQDSQEKHLQGRTKLNKNDLESTYALHSEVLYSNLHETTPYADNVKYHGQGQTSLLIGSENNQGPIQLQDSLSHPFQTHHQALNDLGDFAQTANNVQPDKNNTTPISTSGSQAFTPEFAKLDNGWNVIPSVLQEKSPNIIQSTIPGLNNHQVQFSGDLKNIANIQQLKTDGESLTPNQPAVLQDGDTLVFSQVKKELPHQIQQNPGSQILHHSRGDVISAAPSLTTEKILSELTSPQTNSVKSNWRSEQPALRQDITNQFLGKSIGRENIVAEKNFGQQQFESEGDTQNGNQLNSFAKTSETHGENQIAQSGVNQAQAKPGFSLAESIKPGVTASPLPFSDENIVNQVLNRIRHSQVLQDSKLMLKLHPAELGELKIDVQIKEGTLQASMVAQNQQVQEILERNLPRLREMLEQQGLQVDDIVVSLDSDLGEDFNTFNDHLAQEDGHALSRKNKSTGEIFTVEEDSTETENETTDDAISMVNVKV